MMAGEDKKDLATDAQINTEKLLVSGTKIKLFELNECQMATSDTTENSIQANTSSFNWQIVSGLFYLEVQL